MSQLCGSFYGTPVSTEPDGNGTFMAPSPTDRFPGRHMPGFTPVSRTRNDGAINEKLDRLLSTVNEQKQENAKLRNSLEELSSQLTILQDQVFNDVSSSETGRCRVPPALSAKVKSLHENAPINKQFDGSKRYQSVENQTAKEYLIDQLTSAVDGAHSLRKIKRAVYRYYESRRRIINDSKPLRAEAVKANKQKSRKTALRKQLYERRKKFLKDSEKENWSMIDYTYMTEESDDGEVVHQHKLTWRSEELNRLIKKLERRRKRREPQSGFKLKERVLASPSTLVKPQNCPDWASQT